MKLKILSVQLIQSSDLFKAICEHFNNNWNDDFAGEFSDACTHVSYGDASHTLINWDTFKQVLEGMEHGFTPEKLDEIKAWIPEGVMIDLES